MSSPNWSSISWSPVTVTANATGKTATIGWHKRNVPYAPDGTYLQTLDVWIPNSGDEMSPPKPIDTLASRSGPWVVFVHGGAWRDPFVDASAFQQTTHSLLQSASSKNGISMAGIASLNYRLSHFPHHPTNPYPPKDTNSSLDAARDVQHPQHIHDVLDGMVYLQSLGGANNYIMVGHSCGATLIFQTVMDPSRWNYRTSPVPKKPRVLVGLNGLYDLSAFIRNPDKSHEHLLSEYESFTREAFGDDEKTWDAACPAIVKDWTTEWPEGERVFLVQSREDTLVPYSQTAIIKKHLQERAGGQIKIDEIQASGGHNDLWEKGDELSEILKRIVSWTQKTTNQRHRESAAKPSRL